MLSLFAGEETTGKQGNFTGLDAFDLSSLKENVNIKTFCNFGTCNQLTI